MRPWIISLLVFALFAGSNVYFGSPSLSLLNVIMMAAGIFLVFNLRIRLPRFLALSLKLLVLFVLLETAYLIQFYSSSEQIKDLFYSAHVPLLIFLIFFLIKDKPLRSIIVLADSVLFMLLLCSLIIAIELLTGLHLPSSFNNDVQLSAAIPTAFFHNPNDLAASVTVCFPMIAYIYGRTGLSVKLWLAAATVLFILAVTLSRMSLLLFLTYPLFDQFMKMRFRLIALTTVFFVIAIAMLAGSEIKYFNDRSSLLARNADRIMTIMDLKNEKQIGKSSVNQRTEVFKVILDRPAEYIWGHGLRSDREILASSDVFLISNAHSFIAEQIFNTGFTGLAFLLAILLIPVFLAFANFRKHLFYRYVPVQMLFFLIMVNIPSSVMRMTILWLPVAFIYAVFKLDIPFPFDHKLKSSQI